MAILLIPTGMKAATWIKHLTAVDPDLDIRVWPDAGNPDDIELAMVWNHPLGCLRSFRNLRCIASLGAGVDHILRDPDLPEGIPITRVVHPSMSQSMTEYVVLAVLNYCRHTDAYRDDQAGKQWRPRIPLLAQETGVGIMGLGQLGGHAARMLARLGFQVAGWSRRPKRIEGIRCYAGATEQDAFLASTRILVCLLPLTPETRGILARGLFAKLPAGAYLINVARGAHLVEEDLLAALASGQLSGACLDVFEEEPLPPGHPFWEHPQIRITPHISSLTNPKAVVPLLVDTYHRLKAGRPLQHVVDRARGY